MADEPFSLSVDNDWKRQAQEEKRKLAEEQAKKAAAAAAAPAPITAPTPAVMPGGAAGAPAAPSARGGATRGRRELPQASFTTLVSSLMTQALFYLGDVDMRGGEGTVNLDMAKHQIDTLSTLEQKTVNNLTEDEQKSLDLALYELRSRFVSVASQYIL